MNNLNHNFVIETSEQYRQVYICKNCDLYKEVIDKEWINKDGSVSCVDFIKLFGGDIIYWSYDNHLDFTVIEPTCASMIVRSILI